MALQSKQTTQPSTSDCCCPLKVILVGNATVKATEVGEAISLDQNDAKFASARASTGTGGHDSHSHDMDDTIRTVLKKKNCVVLDCRYQIDFRLEGGCPPFDFRIATGSRITSLHTCLPSSGSIVLTRSDIYEGNLLSGRAKEPLVVEGVARDCLDTTARCVIEIPQP